MTSNTPAEKATERRTASSTTTQAASSGCPNCSGDTGQPDRAGPDTVRWTCCGRIVDDRDLGGAPEAGCNCQHLPADVDCASCRIDQEDPA